MSIEVIKNIYETAPIEMPPKLVVEDLASFLAKEIPARELLLSPWLPKAGLGMIHAYRGIGKTHIALGIAYAVAQGGKFLSWEATKPAKVLYVDGEMPAATLQERLARIVLMGGNDQILGALNIITPDSQIDGSMPDLATKEGQELLNKYITDDIDLVILDNLSCLAPSIKENEASDWAIIQTWVLSLRKRGKAVLFIHHAGKTGLQRGTSKKEDVLDTVIVLERPKDYEANQGARFIVKYEKSRGFFGDDAKAFEAQLCDDGTGQYSWKYKLMEEDTYHKVVTMLNSGDRQKDISIELEVDKSTVSRHATKARQEGLLTRSKSK